MQIETSERLCRAERHFINALLKLMEQKDFHSITVHELSDSAQYDRRTYYRYFNTKEDILNLYCSCILIEMAKMMSEAGPLTLRSGVLSYFLFWEKHMDFLSLLEKHNLLHFLGDQLDDLFYRFVGRAVQPEIPEQFESVSAFSKYSFYFTSGGLWNVLVHWVKESPRSSPEDVTEHILTYFKEMEATVTSAKL